MGTKGQVAWWPSSYGRGFPSEAWGSQEKLSLFYSYTSYHNECFDSIWDGSVTVKIFYTESYGEEG